MAIVSVPTVGRLQSAAMDFGVGALGGIVFNIASSIFGNSLLGGPAAASAAGAILPGPRGQILAVTTGFQAISASALGGGGGGGGGGGEEAGPADL